VDKLLRSLPDDLDGRQGNCIEAGIPDSAAGGSRPGRRRSYFKYVNEALARTFLQFIPYTLLAQWLA